MEKFTQEFRRHKNASVNVDELGEVLKVRPASLVEHASFSPLPPQMQARGLLVT